VHADIKPGNIHWCPEEYCAKLIDYGLSFHIQDKVNSRGRISPQHPQDYLSLFPFTKAKIALPLKTQSVRPETAFKF
jgi:serine/threonine protein kinase